MYRFKCLTSGKEFDQYVRHYADKDLVTCPECGGKTKKLPTVPNVSTAGTFKMVGHVHPKLGGEPIKSVKDFENRCDAKGFYPQTKGDLIDLD